MKGAGVAGGRGGVTDRPPFGDWLERGRLGGLAGRLG